MTAGGDVIGHAEVVIGYLTRSAATAMSRHS